MKLFIKRIIFIVASLGPALYMNAYAAMVKPEAYGLPEFASRKSILGGLIKVSSVNPHGFITNTIAEGIKYVGLLAVISMTVGGIMYMVSFGQDAKIKKAKNIIFYSMIGVVVSITAYSLVDMINNIKL